MVFMKCSFHIDRLTQSVLDAFYVPLVYRYDDGIECDES